MEATLPIITLFGEGLFNSSEMGGVNGGVQKWMQGLSLQNSLTLTVV